MKRVVARVLLDAVAHACVLATVAYATRWRECGRGWESVPEREPDPSLPSLTIVVPARNEELGIERCVRSLLAQRYPDFEVIVVDDRSTDATGTMLRRVARDNPRLRLIEGEPLPAGWVGKTWAVMQAVRHARGDWLCFTDADTFHQPLAAASIVAFARERGIDLLTLGLHHELEKSWERALMPSILGFLTLLSGSAREVNDRRTRAVMANGQYLLARRAAYEALGAHAAVRGEILEDYALARRMKHDGRFRFFIAACGALVSVRMYGTLPAMWCGFVRYIYSGTRKTPPALALGTTFAMLLSYAPAVVVAAGLRRRRPIHAIEGALALFGTVVVTMRAFRGVGHPRRYALFAPLAIGVVAAMGCSAGVQMMFGGGVEWRGERYH